MEGRKRREGKGRRGERPLTHRRALSKSVGVNIASDC